MSYLPVKCESIRAYVADSFWHDVCPVEKYGKLDNGVVKKNFSFLMRYGSPKVPRLKRKG